MKSPTIKRVNADSVIYTGPCWLVGVVVSGDGVQAQVDIYDGTNTSGTAIFRVSTVVDGTSPVILNKFILCQQGIYVDVQAATDFVTIMYYPADKADLTKYPG